jgi:ligand-binding sensor domain-containing protein
VFYNNFYYFFTKPNNDIYQYDPINEKTIKLGSNLNLISFLQTEEQLFFYNKSGVFIIDDKIGSFIETPTDLAVIRDNSLIIANKNLLSLYQQNKLIHSLVTSGNISAITPEYNSDNFYTVTNDGHIHKYDKQLNELKHGYSKSTKKHIKNMYHDSTNTMWLANTQGIERLSENSIQNHPYFFNTRMNYIEIEQFNGRLVIGSYGTGLHSFKNNDEHWQKINKHFSKKALRIFDLLAIEDDLYIATYDGVWRYKSSSKSLERLNFANNNKVILSLVVKGEQLFIATDGNGFLIYDLTKQEITDNIDKSFNFSSPEVIDILPLDQNTIWLTTAQNVDIYNVNSRTIESIELPGSTKAISFAVADNKIFVATQGDGIFIFNQQQELLSRIAVGIDFNYIRTINNEIWAPSLSGLYRISPINHEVTMEPNTENYSFTSEPTLYKNGVYIGHTGGVLEVPLSKNEKFNPKIFISKTMVSGRSYLQNKAINIESKSDVITFDLASLDYRAGQEKQYKYQINNDRWQNVNGSQLTLTGLSSGEYYVAIKGTNSLGQWSDFQAFANINVAYPWYWTKSMRIVYAISLFSLIVTIARLLFLRARSISQIHQLLSADLETRGMASLNVSRNLVHAVELYNKVILAPPKIADKPPSDIYEIEEQQQQIKTILVNCINELTKQKENNEPDALYGKDLVIALPYFANYLHKKYRVKVTLQIDISAEDVNYELQSDIYKIIYEAIISAVLNDTGHQFNVVIQIFKQKLWLTISDDRNSFNNFASKISFDMAMYYIRQITQKHSASMNTFNERSEGSQLVICIPLMKLT